MLYNSTMTDAAVMQALFTKFQDLWRSGKDTHLSFECHAGQAWVNLRVHLHQPHQPHPPEYQWKPGPARLRRRAWRAIARSSAARNAPAKTNHEVIENRTFDKNSELAGQAVILPPTHADDPTEEVDEILEHPTECEQADEKCNSNTESRQLN